MERKEDCFHLGAKALLQNTEGKLLLLQKNPKEPHQNVECLWDLPGGRINRGESLEEALKREVFEETGLNSMTQIEPFHNGAIG
jgi:ADP-ribose pyrophosphatase YjhB (NUDIX family)